MKKSCKNDKGFYLENKKQTGYTNNGGARPSRVELHVPPTPERMGKWV